MACRRECCSPVAPEGNAVCLSGHRLVRHQACAKRHRSSFAAAPDAQLCQDPRDMDAGGLGRDEQGGGDLVVARTVCEQPASTWSLRSVKRSQGRRRGGRLQRRRRGDGIDGARQRPRGGQQLVDLLAAGRAAGEVLLEGRALGRRPARPAGRRRWRRPSARVRVRSTASAHHRPSRELVAHLLQAEPHAALDRCRSASRASRRSRCG